jgi:hypothetical protein
VHLPFFVVIRDMIAFGTGCAVLRAHRSGALMPPPTRSESICPGQGDFIMAARDPRRRLGTHRLGMLALGIPCLMVGCGEDRSKPATVDAEQGKKVQQYMKNYREQIIADNKAKAEAKAAAKKSP